MDVSSRPFLNRIKCVSQSWLVEIFFKINYFDRDHLWEPFVIKMNSIQTHKFESTKTCALVHKHFLLFFFFYWFAIELCTCIESIEEMDWLPKKNFWTKLTLTKARIICWLGLRRICNLTNKRIYIDKQPVLAKRPISIKTWDKN